MPIRIQNAQRIAGFVTQNVMAGGMAPVLVKATLTSDDAAFHVYMESITKSFLSRAGLLADRVIAFLLVFHSDNSVDLYANDDLAIIAEARTKRPVKAGQPVSTRDMIDIRRVQFPGTSISPDDRVIYCAKVGWKFGLHFDLVPEGDLDVDALYRDLGALHRQLMYEHLYKSIEPSSAFDALIADGWFPFAELIPDDWRSLVAAYADRFDFEARVERLVQSFNGARIERIAERWWDKSVFAAKQKLLGAGVRAYMQGDDDGYVSCIKTLATEIEGTLRAQHAADTGEAKKLRTPALIQHLIDKEVVRAGHEDSLLLPLQFLRYLRDVVFRNFDVSTGDLELSRNTAGHGVARPEAYTQARALQLVLTVDQLWFFS